MYKVFISWTPIHVTDDIEVHKKFLNMMLDSSWKEKIHYINKNV